MPRGPRLTLEVLGAGLYSAVRRTVPAKANHGNRIDQFAVWWVAYGSVGLRSKPRLPEAQNRPLLTQWPTAADFQYLVLNRRVTIPGLAGMQPTPEL